MPHSSSFLIFLFGALTFVLPSGYSWGPAALLILSVSYHSYNPGNIKTISLKNSLPIILPFLCFFCAAVLEVLIHNSDIRVLDKPSRFIAALIILPFLIRFPPNPMWLWLGLSIGAMTAAGLAFKQVFFDGIARAHGNTQGIQFGNLSMLFGLLSLCGQIWLLEARNHSKTLHIIMLLGFTGGILGSILSGSRGGWIALPVSLVILGLAYLKYLTPKGLVIAIFAFSIAVAITVPLGGKMIEYRATTAVSEIDAYLESGNSTTSVGARFELWKAAWLLAADKPLFGWGSKNIRSGLKELVATNQVNASVLRYRHAHNDYMNILQTQGFLGLTTLLLIYLMPATVFFKTLMTGSPRALPLAGVVTCSCYMTFSLTQAFLEHNSGVMVYIILIMAFWSTIKITKQNSPTAKEILNQGLRSPSKSKHHPNTMNLNV